MLMIKLVFIELLWMKLRFF